MDGQWFQTVGQWEQWVEEERRIAEANCLLALEEKYPQLKTWSEHERIVEDQRQ